MKEWRRLDKEGALRGPQKLFFQKTKPNEEFYDTLNDPHEINNHIDSAQHSERIANMRTQLERWSEQTGDLGGTPEEDLIERMWPGRKQPVTAVPTIEIDAKRAIIQCATDGASIGYRLSNDGPWQLYSKPIQLKGVAMMQAKAIRIGYEESEIAKMPISRRE